MKPQHSRLIAVLLILVLCVGIALWRHQTSTQTVVSTTTTEAKDDEEASAPVVVEVVAASLHSMETTVAAQGILTPGQGQSARVAPPVAGRLTGVLVREGQYISAGQIVARLDNQAARAQTGSALAAVVAAEADVSSADLSTQATQSETNNAIKQATLNLGAARQTRTQSIAQAQNALQQASAEWQRARLAAGAPDVEGAVDQAKLTLTSAEAARESAVQQAQNAIEQAQAELDKTKAGARPQEIAQAQRAVDSAVATKGRAVAEVERVQFLFDKGIKARRELEDAKTALRVSEANLQSAQDALALVKAGARREEIQAAQLRVEGAKQALAAAQKSGDAQISEAQAALNLAEKNAAQAGKTRPEDIRAAQLKVDAARELLKQAQQSGDAQVAQMGAALEAARAAQVQVGVKAADAGARRAAVQAKRADVSAAIAQAATLELRAPLSGLVLKRNLNPGDVADTTTPVIEIANTRSLDLMANLPAESAALVRAGQSARVRAESAPGKSFSAQVRSVGQVDPQSGLLAVRLAVFDASGTLKIGALASAQIITSTRPLAVTVPPQAVITREGKPALFVMQNDKAQQREITVGAAQNGLLEIRSGLKVGEKVIRLGQYELEDGGEVKLAGKANEEKE